MPVIARTMLYRKPSASTSIHTHSSWRFTRTRNVIVRTLREAVRPVRLEAPEVVPADAGTGPPGASARGVEPTAAAEPGVLPQERVGDAAVVARRTGTSSAPRRLLASERSAPRPRTPSRTLTSSGSFAFIGLHHRRAVQASWPCRQFAHLPDGVNPGYRCGRWQFARMRWLRCVMLCDGLLRPSPAPCGTAGLRLPPGERPCRRSGSIILRLRMRSLWPAD